MNVRTGGLALATVLALAVSGAGAGTAGATGSGHATWVGAWSAGYAVPGPNNPAPFAGFTNQSVRMLVRTSISGESIRLRLANTFGDRHLTVGHVTVALPEPDTTDRQDFDPATLQDVTFNGGGTSVLVPKGSEVLSDPVRLRVPALQELVVTLFFPDPTGVPTFHGVASAFSYVGAGDLAADPGITGFTATRTNLYYLTGVDVLTKHAEGAVVVVGDSIADGAFSTFNGWGRWSDRLAERLQAEHPFGRNEIGVLNEGIGGNQINHDGTEVGTGAGSPGLGVNAIARLDRDVFGQAGEQIVFVCLGVNDIQLSGDSAEKVIAGLNQLATQLREAGLVVIVGTIMPFEGYVNWTPEKEVVRQAVNVFIRGTGNFHKVIDFDAVMQDPAQPTRLRPDWDSGDHIHPNPTGYAAMGDAVPLRWLAEAAR